MSAVRVKICGLTRIEDVRSAVNAGADALGLVFTPRSKRFIEPRLAAELAAEMPAFVARVGLFMDQDAQEVENVLRQVPLSLLQFHGSEPPAFCARFGRPWIKAVSMATQDSVRQAEARYADAAALLLDSHAVGGAGGTGQVFDWSLISSTSRPLVLAGGLHPGNVRAAVQAVRPWAVDVSSGVEDRPGIKNAEKVKQFINEAKS
jgi:phosphoribosylanthranilate isomerase